MAAGRLALLLSGLTPAGSALTFPRLACRPWRGSS